MDELKKFLIQAKSRGYAAGGESISSQESVTDTSIASDKYPVN